MKCPHTYSCKECQYQVSNIDLANLKTAAREAINSKPEPEDRMRGTGCGRIYIAGLRIRKGSKVAKVLQSEGFRLTERPYSKGLSIYVGYDNATGSEYTKGNAIARVLNKHDICCSCDGDGD